jgi:hypothetical protein
MTYTIWSHGKLLGESALSYVRVFPQLRMGDLDVTPEGLACFERLTQHRADAYYSARRLREKKSLDESDIKTFHADLAAQHDGYEALALELRASDGAVIPTEDIYVTDTEYLLSIANDGEAETDDLPGEPQEELLHPDDLKALEDRLEEFAEREKWSPEAPEKEFARFQVSVMLSNEWSIP